MKPGRLHPAPRLARWLLERRVHIGIVEFPRNRFVEIIASRLVRIGGIREEIDTYRLCQDRSFGGRFPKASRGKGSDALVRLMSESTFFLESLDDRKIHHLIELNGGTDASEFPVDVCRVLPRPFEICRI